MALLLRGLLRNGRIRWCSGHIVLSPNPWPSKPACRAGTWHERLVLEVVLPLSIWGRRSSQSKIRAGAGSQPAPAVLGERLIRHPRRIGGQRPLDRQDLVGVQPPSGSPSAVCRDTATAMPSSGAPDDTGQSEPNASGAPESSDAADPVLLVRAFGAEARHGQHRHQRVQLRPQRLHVRDHPELGEPVDVGVVDQLRSARSPAAGREARCAAPHPRSHPAPGARPRRRWRGCGSAGRDRRPGARPRQASRPPSCAARGCAGAEQYGASSAPVSFSTTPSAKNFTVWAVSSGEPTSSTRRRASAKFVDLRIEVARVGVEGEVEPHPQHIAAGRRDVGVDVGGFDPGILHPRHPAGQVVVGGRAQRRRSHAASSRAGITASPDRPRPTRAACRAPTRPRGAGSRRAPGRGCPR